MADDTDLVIKTAPGGVYHGTFQEPIPERGGLGYAWDKGVGLGQGVIDLLASPMAVARDTAYYQDDREAAQRVMEASADVKRKMSGWKTPWGQAQEEGKVPSDDSAIGMIADAIPAAAAIGLSGPMAPVVGGTLAHGLQRGNQWDIIRRAPDDILKESNPKYAEYRDQGMSIEDAKQQVFKDGLTVESVGYNVIPNAVMAGLGQQFMSSMANRVLRTDAGNMAIRIMKNAGVGGLEGAVGGVALGSGTEAGTQAAQIGEGFQTKMDWGKVAEAGYAPGVNLAMIGTVAGGIKGFRQPTHPIARTALGKTDEILDNTGVTPPSADQIGSDLLLVTGAELGGRRPTPPLEPRATPAETARTGTPQVPSTEVTPPGRPVPSEVPSAAVSPKPPVAEPPPVRLPIPPTEREAAASPTSTGEIPTRPIPVPASPVEPRPVPVEGADVSARVVSGERATPVAPVTETAPVAAAPPVEPARQPMTVDELRARALDLNQSPTAGDVVKAIADWQRDNPGVKLGASYNEIVKAAADVRRAEVERIKTEKAAAVAEERAAKKQAAEDAKAAKAKVEAAKVEAAKAEPKAPTVAESIQDRIETVKKAREAEGKPVAAAEPEPTIGEKVKAKVEEPKPANLPPELPADTKFGREPAGYNAQGEAIYQRKDGSRTVMLEGNRPIEEPINDIGKERGQTFGGSERGDRFKLAHEVEKPKLADAKQQLQAAREALGEHDAAVDRKHVGDSVGASLEKRTPEHVAEGNRLLQRVKDLEAQTKKAPVTGAKTTEALAQREKNKQERADLAALKTKEAIEKRDKTDVATDQQYERREGKKSEREQAAIKVFGDKSAAIDELKPLHDRIEKARPSQAKEDLQTAQRHIQGIVDGYNSELRTRGLPTLGGKFPDVVSTRAGHGAHHNVMTTLNNLARTLRRTIDTDGTRAKEAALRGLELTRKVREGKVEEVEAERAKAADAESMRRKSVTQGDRTDQIVSEPHEEKGASDKAPRVVTQEDIRKNNYVDGKPLFADQNKVEHLRDIAIEKMMNGDKLRTTVDGQEFVKMVEKEGGEKVEHSTLGEVMAPFRPKDPIMGAVFDAVHNMVKDMRTVTWSPEMHDAYYAANDWGKPSRAFYQPETATVFFKPDTKVARTVFHEALHAATARALDGSERLNHLVRSLQDIVADRMMANIKGQDSLAYRVSIMGGGKRVDAHEFISELFTRPEVREMVEGVKLSQAEYKQLTGEGFVPNKGRTLLGALWDGFLKAIGYNPIRPNAMKVAVDMLQDVFEREGALRQRDVDLGVVGPVGRYFQGTDIKNLAAQDPIHGTAAHKAMLAGNHAEAANHLMDMADKMDERTADASIKYLNDVNDMYYEHPPGVHAEMEVTHMSNTEQVRGGVEKFLGDRFGADSKMADRGYQIDKLFATPLRHLVQGLRYTNDLGNNLEKGFRDAIEPMKQWWSKREHFAQEYMDKSGANKLIDDLATLKHAIKDRGLWEDFEKLLVRESYTRAFADEELGVGRNAHIDTGSLRDYQTTQDHKANQALMQTIRDRDPSGRLIEMRNRIHDFEAADLEARKRAQASDMLTRMKIVDPSDRTGMLALIRDVRNETVKMTPEEKTAFDRIVGSDHKSKQFKDYVKNRDVIRSMLDQTDKNGPHVPFMRHGNHVVTAKYHVSPTAVGKFHPIDPAADLIKGYDFENLSDARDFVKNVLSRDDIQITQTGGREVVYDTRTGEAAKIWTVEKADGTAKTFENEHDAERSMEKGDELKSREITPDDVKRRAEDNQPTDHFKVYNRVEFNPQEYVRFESERAANEYRNRINLDTHDPNFRIDVQNVETPRDISPRGVATHASSEMTQWINRVEASPAYQKMTKEGQADWKRELQAEAARVTMMTGRRSINLPREYVKGASTDILKNLIQSTGASARAIAGNVYNPRIQLAREAAQRYTNQFENQTGGEGRNHRARQDVLDEFDRRLHAPVRVDGSWAQGIKRALQVSMISHLADASFLVINAMEPWILGAAITASRHGWIGSYSELAKANALIDPIKMAKMAAVESWQAGWKGKYQPADYEGHLLQAVSGERDAKGLQALFNHMFGRGLVSRDSGMEVERIHDPSSNVVGRFTDRVDATFRGGNTGIETLNRASMGIANFRLEYRRALKEGRTEAQAEAQAIKYAEDSIFKAAGDYGQWNNPRYFNNPFMKLGTQFKKYPLRIASVYADAIIQATRGDKQAMKQVAYMLATQGITAGALGLPLGPFAGTVNAAYILGISDNKWSDYEFAARKYLVDQGLSPEMTDLALRGALRFSGADFHPRLTQNSMVFFGDPDSRKPQDLLGVVGKTLLGSPGGWGANALKGFQQLSEAASDYHAGAHEQAQQKGMQGVDNIIQIKALHNLVKAFHDMTAGPLGMPKGNETNTGQAIMQGIGFGPVQVARKQEEKRTIQAAKKNEQLSHSTWVNRWRDAPNSAEQSAIWAQIQKNYNPTVPPEQRIQYSTLLKAQNAKKKADKRDDSKLGVPLSGRQKSFADIGKYFSTQ